jgi:hypothetical protein
MISSPLSSLTRSRTRFSAATRADLRRSAPSAAKLLSGRPRRVGGPDIVDPDGRKLVFTLLRHRARRVQQKEMMKIMDLTTNLAASRPMRRTGVWRKTHEVLLEKAL